MERRIHYLFVDLGYLRDRYSVFAGRWFQAEGGIDFHAFHRHAHAPAKTFYYDRNGEEKGGTLDRIRSAPGAHLRTGEVLDGRRKGVDVQLAVDLLQHATRGRMTHATLLSGDADFAPVVSALVDCGADVTVWAEADSVAPSLRFAADHFLPLRWQDHHHWTDERTADAARLPGIGSSVAHRLEGSRESYTRNGWRRLESGSIGTAARRADLWVMESAEAPQYSLAVEHVDASEATPVATVSHSDRTLLLRYAELEWGALNLAPVES